MSDNNTKTVGQVIREIKEDLSKSVVLSTSFIDSITWYMREVAQIAYQNGLEQGRKESENKDGK